MERVLFNNTMFFRKNLDNPLTKRYIPLKDQRTGEMGGVMIDVEAEPIRFIPRAEFFDGNRAVTLQMCEYAGGEDCFHYHEFHELVLVLDGSGLHVTREREYPIFPGDVFLIRPPQVHAYRNLRQLSIVNILYLPEQFEKELEMLKPLLGFYAVFESDPRLAAKPRYAGRLTLTGENFAAARELVRRMLREEQRRTPGWEYMTRLLFQELLLLICRSFSNRESIRSEANVKISRALRFLEENYARRVTLGEVAKFCNCSVPSLTRLFREALGAGPIGTLNSLRLDKAAELLRNSELSITVIAAKTGFCDSNYLTKCFKRRFHLSPRAYRRAEQ